MVNTEKWILVTGSPSKVATLELAVKKAGLGIEVAHLPCPKPVHEIHNPLHSSSRYAYADKIWQTWDHSKNRLEGAVGIGNDVCPKVKGAGESQYRKTLYKYHQKKGKDIEEMGYRSRLDALSWYISLVFGQYREKDAIDLRQSIGVGVFDERGIHGELIQKIYTHYPSNPLPSPAAIKESLVYSAEHHVCVVDGQKDNQDLGVNSAAAGGILAISLLEWYLQTNLGSKVILDGLGDKPDLNEIEMLGRGFTAHMARNINELAKGRKKGVTTAQALAYSATIPITQMGHCSVVWSRDEGRCVIE